MRKKRLKRLSKRKKNILDSKCDYNTRVIINYKTMKKYLIEKRIKII